MGPATRLSARPSGPPRRRGNREKPQTRPADTSGVAREIFTWSLWAANARGPSFAGQEDHVIFDGCRGLGHGFSWSRRDQFLVGMLRLEVFVLVVLMLAVSGIMFGVFLSHIRSEFRPVGSAAGFNFRGFFFREFRNLGDCCFLIFFRTFFCLFF